MASMRALSQAQDENIAIRKHWQTRWFQYARDVLEHDGTALVAEEGTAIPVRKPKKQRAPMVTFSEQYSIRERRQREKAECMVLRSNRTLTGLVSYTKTHVKTCAEAVHITPQKLMPAKSVDSDDSDNGVQHTVQRLPTRRSPSVRESPYAAAGRIVVRSQDASSNDGGHRKSARNRPFRQAAPPEKEQLVRAVSWRMPQEDKVGRGRSQNSSPSRTANSGRHFSSARSSSESPARRKPQSRRTRRARTPSSSRERAGDSDASGRSGRRGHSQTCQPRRLATNLMKSRGSDIGTANTVKMVPKQKAPSKPAAKTPGARSLKHMMSSARRGSSRSGSEGDSSSRDSGSRPTSPSPARPQAVGATRSLKRLVSKVNHDSDNESGGSRSSASPAQTPRQGASRTLQRTMTSVKRGSDSDADSDKASSRSNSRSTTRAPATKQQPGSRSLKPATAPRKRSSDSGSDVDNRSTCSGTSSRPSPTHVQQQNMSRSLSRLVTSATQRGSDSDAGSDKGSRRSVGGKSIKSVSSAQAQLSNSRSLRRLMSNAHKQDSDDEDPLQNSLLMMYGIPR